MADDLYGMCAGLCVRSVLGGCGVGGATKIMGGGISARQVFASSAKPALCVTLIAQMDPRSRAPDNTSLTSFLLATFHLTIASGFLIQYGGFSAGVSLEYSISRSSDQAPARGGPCARNIVAAESKHGSCASTRKSAAAGAKREARYSQEEGGIRKHTC